MSTIREDFFTAKAKGSLWDVAVSIKRGNPLPLDADSIFESYAALEAYAADVLAYPGQVVAVVNEDSTGIYYLDQNLAIKPVGVIPAGDELSVDMDDSDVISLHNFGKLFYKYVAENGDVAAHYEKVDVSDATPWVAGLEPRVVTEDGKLVLGWYEPNPTTIDGVNDQVTAVQGTVSDLVDSVGAPSTENSEATGLYKEVEDVQEDVKELTDAVGSADDSLGDDVQTLWAHVNDHTDRLEDLEAIDHSLFATKEELAAEADRADKAEKANAAAIKVIADDYLKAADIANMATDAVVEAAVKAEADRAKGVEESLQNQINLIMDNPETENVIDSINEFMKYIEEHGDIAEGFRTDIGANSDAIAAEIERATGAEGVLSGRLDILEAIDHDAYIGANAALKAELEAEIEKKADAETVASDIATAKQAAIDAAATDATTKANAAKDAAIADADAKLALKANAADVYTKNDIYTKAEADKAIEEALSKATGGESAADVLVALDNYKKFINTEVFGNEAGTGDSRIDSAETKLADIEAGAQVNVIEAIEAAANAKIIASKSGKTVTIDDSALQTLISAAHNLAQNGLDAANAADAKAVQNQADILAHGGRLDTLEILVNGDEQANGLLKDVAALKAHDEAHGAEFAALNQTVSTNSQDIAGLKTGKADTSVTDALNGRVTANENALKTLNETTIPNMNGVIASKADASALNNYYTKEQIGTIAENKTIVQMIADAQVAATYDDTAVKTLIANETSRADTEEKRLAGLIADNAADIVAINAVLNTVDDTDAITSLKELATWVQEHGKDAGEMLKAIEANADGVATNLAAIQAINDADNGILAQAKAHAAGLVNGIPTATAEVLGLVKFDDATIKMNESSQLYVAKVSTDILEQGENILVLNGGNA